MGGRYAPGQATLCGTRTGSPMAMIESGLVSTIIPVYNRPALVVEAISSVLAQTYRPIEILVVDDGSTDGTPAVLQALAAQYPEVVVLRQPNGGVGAARERGRLHARGEFVQYLDSDDRLLPDKFTLQVQALRERPECGIAYCVTRLIDADGGLVAEPYKWTARSFDYLLPALLVDRWWNTQTPLYRRAVIDAAGPWPTLSMSEDWAYEARIAAQRVRLVRVRETLCETRLHAGVRLTGGGISVRLIEAQASLQRELLDAARAADVSPQAIELRHLGRWAFSLSRRAAAAQMPEVAGRCLVVAQQASRAFIRDRVEIALYRALIQLLGWQRCGRALEWLAARRPAPGVGSLPSSTRR